MDQRAAIFEFVFKIRLCQVIIALTLFDYNFDFSKLTRTEKRVYFITFDSYLMNVLDAWDRQPLQLFDSVVQRNIRKVLYRRFRYLNSLARDRL